MTRIGSTTSVVSVLVAVGIVGTVVFGGSLVFPAAGDGELTERTASDQAGSPLLQSDIDADAIEMEATIELTGDAVWRVIYRLDLEDEDAIQGFEALRDGIESNTSSYLDPFEDRIRRTVRNAENATGRGMTAENFTVRSERTTQPDTEFGEVIFRFDWNSFAAVEDGETVRVGDAVDGLFLDAGTSLTLRWAESLALDSHIPQANTIERQRLTWRGQLEFGPGEPRATLVTAESDTTPAGDDDTADDTTGDDDTSGADDETAPDGGTGDGGTLPWTVIFVGGLIVAGLAVAAVVFLPRERESGPEPATESEQAAGTEPTEPTESPPDDLLTNEERVLKLVDEQGGRMKQKAVAEQLDWSAARTSQIVGDLREDDRIETFRIGRENVLTLPEVDIVPEGNDEDAAAGPDDGDDPSNPS